MTTVNGQVRSLSTTSVPVRFKAQLNSVLFAKTLVRKDIASSTPLSPSSKVSQNGNADTETPEKDENNFSSKAQIMTLMTTDVDRVSNSAWYFFTLVGSCYFLLRLASIFNVITRCSHRDRHRNTLFVWFTWYEHWIEVAVVFDLIFFRCLLLLRSGRNMFIPSHEPLCWESGLRCVTPIYALEVWCLALYIYSCSRKFDEGSWWASRTHEWSVLAFDLYQNSEWICCLAF